jgi:hypothetical protein
MPRTKAAEPSLRGHAGGGAEAIPLLRSREIELTLSCSSAQNSTQNRKRAFFGILLGVCMLMISGSRAPAQENYCGVTPESARLIAMEIMRHAGHAYDSASSAYYVSVLAARLSPYYVVYFSKGGMLVGEIEVDLCGRQGTPHPGIQYVPDSDVKFDALVLEPDKAFAIIYERKGVEAVFGSRIFPYGLTATIDELGSVDFWWLILDAKGQWHYLSRFGDTRHASPPKPPDSDSARN